MTDRIALLRSRVSDPTYVDHACERIADTLADEVLKSGMPFEYKSDADATMTENTKTKNFKLPDEIEDLPEQLQVRLGLQTEQLNSLRSENQALKAVLRRISEILSHVDPRQPIAASRAPGKPAARRAPGESLVRSLAIKNSWNRRKGLPEISLEEYEREIAEKSLDAQAAAK